MSNLVQCNICQKWYSNQRGLLIHLGFCKERQNFEQSDGNNHLFLGHNPLKSCYNQGEHLDPFAVYEDEFDNSSIEHNSTCIEQVEVEGGGDFTEDDFGSINSNDNLLDNYEGEDIYGHAVQPFQSYKFN